MINPCPGDIDGCNTRKIFLWSAGGSIGCVSGILSSCIPVTATYQAISNALPGEGGAYLGFFLGLCLMSLLSCAGALVGMSVGLSIAECCEPNSADSLSTGTITSYSTF